MNRLKKTFRALSSVLPLPLLQPLSGVRIMPIYHHVVSDEALPHIQNLYSYKNSRQFIKDLDWVLRKFKPAEPAELAQTILSGKKPVPGQFLLSFDDGYRELHDVVAPILLQKGVPAIFFLNPSFIDNKDLFYRCKLSLVLEKAKNNNRYLKPLASYLKAPSNAWETLRKAVLNIQYPGRNEADRLAEIVELDTLKYLETNKPFLTGSQLSYLASKGFTLGAHSLDHPDYQFLDLQEQIRQTTQSIKWIELFAGAGASYFAFPHEDRKIGSHFFSAMKENLPQCLYFGTQNARPEKTRPILQRVNAEDPRVLLSSQIKSALLYNAFLRLSGRQSPERK